MWWNNHTLNYIVNISYSVLSVLLPVACQNIWQLLAFVHIRIKLTVNAEQVMCSVAWNYYPLNWWGNLPSFIESEGSLPCTEESVSRHCLEPDESSPCPYTLFFGSISILSCLFQGLLIGLYYSYFPAKFMYSNFSFPSFILYVLSILFLILSPL